MATYEAAGPTQQMVPALEWRDTKRYAWLLGAIIPMVPVMAWGLVELTGLDAFWFFGPLFVFGVIPLIDLLAGIDPNNPPDEVIEQLENDRYYRWVTYAFIPLQYVVFIWTAWMLGQPQYDWVDKLGMAHTVAETDWHGNYVLSSQVWSTARDLARLGLFWSQDGVWAGQRLLPAG